MQGHTWKVAVLAGVVLVGRAGVGNAVPPVRAVPAPKLADYKDTAVAIAIGSVQGLELAGKVAEQQAAAEANWKRLFSGAKAPQVETEHLLLYGKVPGRTLKDLGAALEKQYQLARTTLGLDKEASWPGKLTIYLLPERPRFTSFVRTVEKRRPEADDLGSFMIRGDLPHLAVGPPRATTDPPMEFLAAEELAAALLSKKVGTGVPDWLISGFGRATYLAGQPREVVAEHRRALKAMLSSKATAAAVWSGTVKSDVAPVLRGSLVEFLAFGPGKKKFLAFLEGFRPEEGMMTKTAVDALTTAGLDPTRVGKSWKIWVRRKGR